MKIKTEWAIKNLYVSQLDDLGRTFNWFPARLSESDRDSIEQDGIHLPLMVQLVENSKFRVATAELLSNIVLWEAWRGRVAARTVCTKALSGVSNRLPHRTSGVHRQKEVPLERYLQHLSTKARQHCPGAENK